MPATSKEPIHGNYRGYYTKRPFQNDTRLSVLPDGLFENKRVLDVGCNEGWVTCEIAQCHNAKLVVGVDIDDVLVQGAWRRRRAVWSTQGPSFVENEAEAEDQEEDGDEDDIRLSTKRKRSNLSPSTSRATARPRPNYFPASCEHEFGPLPIPPSELRGKDAFPHNVSFRTADWPKSEIVEDRGGYDVVLALSLTKWIHLNEGDEGLKRFFNKVFDVLSPGGSFVLEPQSWDSYAKAKRMDERLKENAKKLQLRPEGFEALLLDIGFSTPTHFGYVGQGGFQRPIDLYVKPS